MSKPVLIFRARDPFILRDLGILALGLGALVYDLVDRGNVMGWQSNATLAMGWTVFWAAICYVTRLIYRNRVMRVGLDREGQALDVVNPLFRHRRIPLSDLENWRFMRVEKINSRHGNKVDPAFVADEAGRTQPLILLLEGASLDLRAFLDFAPRAVARLDANQARQDDANPFAERVRFRDISADPFALGVSGSRQDG